MTHSSRLPAIVLGGLAVATAAFFVWMAARPTPAAVPPPPTIAAPAAAAPLAAAVPAPAAASAAAPVHALDVTLVDGRVSGADETLKVRQGERIALTIASDRPIVLHLHGYDIEAHAGPGAPAKLSFDAAVPGRFGMSEHASGAGHHRAVLYLEVHP